MTPSPTLRQSLPGLWRILGQFWPYIRKERPLIVGSLLALFAGIGLRLLEPWPLKFVIDRVSDAAQTGRLASLQDPNELDPQTLIILSALALVAISALRAVADYYNAIGFSLIGNRVTTQVRNDLYRHLQYLSLSFHTRARGGDLIVRVISDVNMLRDVMGIAVLPLLANILILVGMMVFMFWLQWQLALLAMIIIPLFWFFTTRLSRRIHESARRQRLREGAMASTVSESIGAIRIVQALSLEGRFANTFLSQSQESQQEDIKGSRLAAGLGRTVDVLIAIATALVLWYSARLALQQALSPGDLVVFLTYLKRALHPLQDFAKYTGRLAKATAAGERVINLLEETADVRDMPDAVRAPAFRGAVCFEDVSFGYEDGQRVLEEIDFDVQPGTHVVLVGPSGIGKSTLVSLLLRLYDPVRGRVKIDGRDIRTFTLESLRAQTSVVLQDSILFSATVRDNIAYGAPGATWDQIEAAARLANAHEFIRLLPLGYDTILGERGVTLSHGQRQRVAIARAALRQAPILILDEPTTGLDEENERAVIEALENLARGLKSARTRDESSDLPQRCTTFLITHNLLQAVRADLIFYLEDGRILEHGKHKELMQAKGRYAALFRLQTDSMDHVFQEEHRALAS